LIAWRMELVMPPNTTSTFSRWIRRRTLATAVVSLLAVSSRCS